MKKNISTKKHPIGKFLIWAGIAAGLYAAIAYFNLDDYMMYGIGLIIGWVSSLIGTPSNGLTFLQQPLALLQIVAPGLMIGFLLTIARQRNSFRIAFLGTMIAYFIVKVTDAYQFYPWNAAVTIPFLAMLVGYSIVYLVVRWIRNAIVVWLLVIALAAVNILVVPSLTRSISQPITKAKQAAKLSEAAQALKFTAYYPDYTPAGLQTTPAKLEGYNYSAFQHTHVSYSTGKLEFMVSEKLKDQDQVFNKTDNCDIGAIWFAMRSKNEINPAEIANSRDNLSICRLLGKTDSGHDVYIKASKSQFVFYYMEINGTIIVANHDTAPQSRYSTDFEKEVLKMFNSMKPLGPSGLTAGY